ncbi:MAG: SWIM zinc finger family protein [Plectolyngbya sp. WJT66-NPBG17]|nr:SWIM zinc finger family protein [Plectolyngbya sp. WJT66-NPBG17]
MIPNLSEAMIRRHTTGRSFERGQHYCRAGAVSSLIQRGNVLWAQVEGTEAAPYRIRIWVDSGGIKSASCSCLYDYEGWCKHIVATLIDCLYQPIN